MGNEWLYRVGSAANRALGSFDPGELAYLALTSKFELPFRDRLAYEMSLAYPCPPMCTAREWKHTDIAVVEDGEPVVLLEAKALYSFDAANPKTFAKYKGYIHGDIEKASTLATSDTEVMIAVIMTHVAEPVSDEFEGIVKYRSSINNALDAYQNPMALRAEAVIRMGEFVASVGDDEVQRWSKSDIAFGIPVDIDVWISRAVGMESVP